MTGGNVKMGYAAAFAGPALWGILPLFYLLLDGFSAVEIVAQRSLWSFILMAIAYVFLRRLRLIAGHFTFGRHSFMILIGTLLIAVNWIIFVYAVSEGRVVEASFGYFIYPLFAVAGGVLFLKERFDARTKWALAFSMIGVSFKGWSLGMVPDISLALALSFGLYAIVRKQVTINSLDGFFCETIWLLPFVLAFLAFHTASGNPVFFDGEVKGFILAISCGVITTVPLVLFLQGNKMLPLSVTAFIFYVNPTLQLLCGITFFGEGFSPIDMLAFGFIWLGLAIQFIRPKKTKATA